MRPNATNKDVPSGHDVSTYIHNEFVNWVKGMRENLRVNHLPHDCVRTQPDTLHSWPQVKFQPRVTRGWLA